MGVPVAAAAVAAPVLALDDAPVLALDDGLLTADEFELLQAVTPAVSRPIAASAVPPKKAVCLLVDFPFFMLHHQVVVDFCLTIVWQHSNASTAKSVKCLFDNNEAVKAVVVSHHPAAVHDDDLPGGVAPRRDVEHGSGDLVG